MIRHFSLLALLPLAACNQSGLPDFTTTSSVFGATAAPAFRHVIAEKRPVQEAFVQLPRGAGHVVDLTESRYPNGVEQLIVYQGDFETRGENAARIRMVTSHLRAARDGEKLSIKPTTDHAIRREMAKSLPGVRMRVSNVLTTNTYGPFGYAFGKMSAKVACLYGWQHMRGNAPSVSKFPLFNPVSKKPQLSVRLRICKSGASEKQLVNIMRNIRVEADPQQVIARSNAGWNSAPEGRRELAMTPAPLATGYVSDPVVAAPVAKPVVKKRRIVRKTASPKPTPVRETFAPVPLPQGGAVAAPVPAKPLTTAQVAPKVSAPRLIPAKPLAGKYAAVPLPQ